MDLTIVYLALACAFALASYALAPPFLPSELEQRSISKRAEGWIFSTFSVAFLLGCGIVGKIQGKLGRRNILLIGLLMHAAGNFVVGIAYFFHKDSSLYLPAIILVRLAQGLGSSAVLTTAFAIATITYPLRPGLMIAMLEVA